MGQIAGPWSSIYIVLGLGTEGIYSKYERHLGTTDRHAVKKSSVDVKIRKSVQSKPIRSREHVKRFSVIE